jgi:uncharacterized repeat protein (TIGR01451 family)
MINVTNTGNVTLHTEANSTIDAQLTYSADSETGTVDGQIVTWNFDLTSGETKTIYLNATVNYPLVDCMLTTNAVNVLGSPDNGDDVFADYSLNITVCNASITALKVDLTADTASQGGIVQYQINVTNTGNVTLDVDVNDTLDTALLDYRSSSPNGTFSSPMVHWSITDLGPGETATIYLNATVGNVPDQCEITANDLYVLGTPDNGDSVEAYAETLNVTVCNANVSILKAVVTPTAMSPGDKVEWSLNVSNLGNVTFGTVLVQDTLPSGFQYNGSYSETDMNVSVSSNKRYVNWTFTDLAPGDSVVILFNSTVGLVANGTHYNNVSVRATPPNGNAITATSSASVGINAAAVNIDQSVSRSTLTERGRVVYEFTISNSGTVNLTVGARAQLPTGFTFVNANVTPTNNYTDNQTIEWSEIANLTPGSSIVIAYNVTTASSSGSYHNRINVTGTLPNGFNVTDNDSTTVVITVPSTSSGGSGGGAPLGSSNASSSTSSTYGNHVTTSSVDIGNDKTCQVIVTRDIQATSASTVLTTTLQNTGGEGCALTDYEFNDTMPAGFPAPSAVAFSPTPSVTFGRTVSFGFPSFLSGESKVLTYTVSSRLSTSIVSNFTNFTMAAKKTVAAAPVAPTEPEAQTGTTAPVVVPPKKPVQPPATVVTPIAEQPPQDNGFLSMLATILIVGVAIAIVGGVGYYVFVRKRRRGL